MVATADPGAARAPMSRRDVFDAVAPNVEKAVASLIRLHPKLARQREDLIQEGLLALWKLTTRYDPARSKPNTFGLRRVRFALIDYIRGKRQENGLSVRAAMRRQAAGKHVPACVSYHSAESVTDPSSRFGGRDAKDRTAYLLGFDPPPHADDDAAELRAALKCSRTSLSAAERSALADYYAGGLTMREIADRTGVSESRVSQVIAIAIGRIRETMLADGRTSLN